MVPLLIEAACIFQKTIIHTSVARISVVENYKADASSCLTCTAVAEFTCHSNSDFQQQEPWRLRLLPCAAKHHMLTMLHTKWSPRYFLLAHYGSTQPPGRNGKPSMHGFTSHWNSQESRNPYYFSKFSWNEYGRDSLQLTDTPFKN